MSDPVSTATRRAGVQAGVAGDFPLSKYRRTIGHMRDELTDSEIEGLRWLDDVWCRGYGQGAFYRVLRMRDAIHDQPK